MDIKHTPGPWKTYATGLARSGLPEFEIHWSNDGECVAEVVHGEADARLIAAAPDMLQALRRAVLALAFAAESSEAMRDDYNAVSDAIAKATGSASEF